MAFPPRSCHQVSHSLSRLHLKIRGPAGQLRTIFGRGTCVPDEVSEAEAALFQNIHCHLTSQRIYLMGSLHQTPKQHLPAHHVLPRSRQEPGVWRSTSLLKYGREPGLNLKARGQDREQPGSPRDPPQEVEDFSEIKGGK